MQKTILFIFIFLSFVTMGVFGMFLVSQHHHEIGCPFMPGENVMCDMSAYDHLSAWKTVFAATAPTLFILTVVAAALFSLRFFTLPDPPLCIRRSGFRKPKDSDKYQELCLFGILNPRAP